MATKFDITLPQIKNCPFCGSEAREYFVNGISVVMCRNSKCNAKISSNYDAITEYISENNLKPFTNENYPNGIYQPNIHALNAITKWNRRINNER